MTCPTPPKHGTCTTRWTSKFLISNISSIFYKRQGRKYLMRMFVVCSGPLAAWRSSSSRATRSGSRGWSSRRCATATTPWCRSRRSVGGGGGVINTNTASKFPIMVQPSALLRLLFVKLWWTQKYPDIDVTEARATSCSFSGFFLVHFSNLNLELFVQFCFC